MVLKEVAHKDLLSSQPDFSSFFLKSGLRVLIQKIQHIIHIRFIGNSRLQSSPGKLSGELNVIRS